jgi:hypothetical protein
MIKTLSWTPRRRPARRIAAALLRAASAALDRLARRLAAVPQRPAKPLPALQLIEFHAESGAPEGALFVDGELFAYVPGVGRL